MANFRNAPNINNNNNIFPPPTNNDELSVELDLMNPKQDLYNLTEIDNFDQPGPPMALPWKERCFPTRASREIARAAAVSFAILTGLIILLSLVLTIRLARDPFIVLVSIDGLRFDDVMTNLQYTPNLNRMRHEGFTAKLIPVFPATSLPNHYTMLTGLYPESHGIVSERFWDPNMKKTFDSRDPAIALNHDWYNGKPFWQLANEVGIRSACSQFPSCNVKVPGTKPTYLDNYDESVPTDLRIKKILQWLDLSLDKQPAFMASSLLDVDRLSHILGPDSIFTVQALKHIDALIGDLYDAIKEKQKQFDIDLIIVSDHGFQSIEDHVYLEDYIDIDDYRIPELELGSTPQVSIWPNNNSSIPTLIENLANISHISVYTKSDIPEKWHYNDSSRIAPVLLVADPGYLITTRKFYLENPTKLTGGNHGWDPYHINMTGVFIAAGPSFNQNFEVQKLPSFQTTELFNLMAAILDIPTTKNNGTYPFIKGVLIPKMEKKWERKTRPSTPVAST